jgi:hypothetical protein
MIENTGMTSVRAIPARNRNVRNILFPYPRTPRCERANSPLSPLFKRTHLNPQNNFVNSDEEGIVRRSPRYEAEYLYYNAPRWRSRRCDKNIFPLFLDVLAPVVVALAVTAVDLDERGQRAVMNHQVIVDSVRHWEPPYF